MSHSTEIFLGEPLNVSEKSGYRKTLYIVGSYHHFPSNYLSLTAPKRFVVDPFVFQKLSGVERNYE